MVLDKLGLFVQKEENRTLTPHTITKDIHVRSKATKPLEESLGQKLHDIRFSNELFYMASQAWAIAGETDSLHFGKA